FVQSTSVNRRLIGGTKFLYEVEDWDRGDTAPVEAEAPARTAAPAPAPVTKAAPAPAATARPAKAKATAPAPAPAAPAPATAGGGKPARRRFEFVEGTSNKFWEVWVDGTNLYTQYGRIGSAGQTTVKNYPDEAAARKAMEKIIGEKVGKGYIEK